MKLVKSSLTDLFVGFWSSVLSAVFVTAMIYLFANQIAAFAIRSNPTCDAPAGLKPLPAQEIISVKAAHEESPAGTDYSAQAAFDGWGGSLWVPQVEKGDERRRLPRFLHGADNAMEITLKPGNDIRLVCVVNGLANNFTNYQNWARVRTISIGTERIGAAQTSVLRSLGPDSFPNGQFAARDLGETTKLFVRPIDAYVGLTVETFDPDQCLENATGEYATDRERGVQKRYESGCMKSATATAGISEIYLYVSED